MRSKLMGESAPETGATSSPPPAPPKKKKKFRILLLLIVLGLGLAGIYLPQKLVDPKHLTDMVSAQVKVLTGRSLTVKGGVQFFLVPTPKLVLKNIELDTGSGNVYSVPRLRADSLTVQLAFEGLLQGKPVVSGVTLTHPVLDVERSRDGTMHWDWLAIPNGGKGLSVALNVEGGRLIYFNPMNDKTVRVEDINVMIVQNAATGLSITGRLSYLGKTLNTRLALPPYAGGQQGTRIDIKVWQSDTTLLSAVLDRVAVKPAAPVPQNSASDILPMDDAVWHGDLKLQVEDVNQWLPKDEPKQQPSNLMGADVQKGLPATVSKTPYPLKLAGKIDYSGNVMKVSEVTVESSDSAGKGDITLTTGATPSLNVHLVFNHLKVEAYTVTSYLGTNKNIIASSGFAVPPSPVDIAEASPRIPKDLDMTFDLGVETLLVDTEQFTGVTLAGKVTGGELLVDSLKGSFAGGTVISLSGKMVDTAKGMRFQGRTQTSGKDFRAVLAAIDPAAAHLPDKGFQEFNVESNIFISSEQMRLSEADFRLGDLHLNGGLVTYFEQRPRVEADIALKDINLDYFRDNWREEIKRNGTHNFIFKINSSVDFSWLKTLKPTIDLRLNLQRFTFMEKQGDYASCQFYAEQNAFGIRNIEMRFPNGNIKGNVNVTVNGSLPHLDVDLEFPEIDTVYFSEDGKQFGEPLVNPGKPDARWSDSLFDFSWMIGVTAKINLAVQRFIHHGETYDRMLMQGNLSNEQLQITSLAFDRFGGKFDFSGFLTGGKVPGLSTRFTVFNMDIRQVMSTFFNVEQLSGRMSVSGSLTTSGISFLEWLKEADMKMSIAGRGVRVDNFNLHGVSDAVLASRSVAEVVTNVNKVLPTDSTDFSVDGTVNVSNATMRTPGLALMANYEQGTLTGELRLLQWKMAMNSVYQMRMLPTETSVPTLTVDVSGTPDQHDMKLDTSSLEAYVAKRIVGD